MVGCLAGLLDCVSEVTGLTEIQILLLRQLTERPLSRLGRIPQFCLELEAEGYVKVTPVGASNIAIEITDRGRKAIADVDRPAAVIPLGQAQRGE
jgi:hypothetical protein